jgi:hypothetical protein
LDVTGWEQGREGGELDIAEDSKEPDEILDAAGDKGGEREGLIAAGGELIG